MVIERTTGHIIFSLVNMRLNIVCLSLLDAVITALRGNNQVKASDDDVDDRDRRPN